MEKKLTVGLYQKSPHYLKVLQTRFKIYVLLIIHVQMTNNQTSPITPPIIIIIIIIIIMLKM